MRLAKARVEGFRLLEDIELQLEEGSTVIVGRNNSGKTSLTEAFDRFSGEHGSKFRLEDFSFASRRKFHEARKLRLNRASPDDILKVLPTISLTLTLSYSGTRLH